jgi:hypothetical protein
VCVLFVRACVCCVCTWVFVRHFCVLIVRAGVCCVCAWIFVLPLNRHHAQIREFSLGIFVYCFCVRVCAVCAHGYLYCHSSLSAEREFCHLMGIMHKDVSSAWAFLCIVCVCVCVLCVGVGNCSATQEASCTEM